MNQNQKKSDSKNFTQYHISLCTQPNYCKISKAEKSTF